LWDPQRKLSEEIQEKIQVQGAAWPLTREEFHCTPELEGFVFVTVCSGNKSQVRKASDMGGGYTPDMFFSCQWEGLGWSD